MSNSAITHAVTPDERRAFMEAIMRPPGNDYADSLVVAADLLAAALTCLRAASADGPTAIHRAAVRPLIAPLAELHARSFELASAAKEPK